MKKRSELIFSLVLVPTDYLMMIVGFVAAYLFRQDSTKPFAYMVGGYVYLRYLVILLPIWVLIFAMLGLYSLESTRSRLSELVRVFIASACGVMALILLDFLSQDPIFPSKSIPVYGFVFTVSLIALARLVVGTVQRILFNYGVGVHQTLIIAPARVVETITDELGPAYKVMNSAYTGDLRGAQAEDVAKFHAKYHLDEVLHAYSEGSQDTSLMTFCQSHHITYKFVPNIGGIYGANVHTSLYGGVPVLELQQTPLDGWGRILKRVVDFITSLFALVFLAPFFLVLGVVIKITDPGPVFYAHERLSRTGKKIRVYKFRSMKAAYCSGGKYDGKSPEEVLAGFGDPKLLVEFKKYQKIKKDPRVSRLGRFLRKTSVDELPQLFNVLKGDLSLVGPRPIIDSELERYGGAGGKFLAIKPGLTGLWQVSGRNDIGYDERVKLDIYYVENWSVWLDISILWRTLGVILGGRGY